jgi:hypothetical protein
MSYVTRQSIVAVLVALFACFPPTVAAVDPEIAVDRDSLELGDIEEGQKAHAEFFITNRGGAPLVIKEVRTSCGCTEATIRVNELPPGEKAATSVTYDSTGLSHGRKTQSVMVESNDPRYPVVKVRVFAQVIRLVSVEPTSLVARLPRFQQQMVFPVTIKNHGQEPITVSVSTWEGAIANAALEPTETQIDPNSEARVRIRMDLTKPEKGRIVNGRLSLTTNHASTKRMDLRLLIKLDQD